MRTPTSLFASLLALVSLSACGGVSVAPSPTVSCESRGCDRAVRSAAASLECPEGEVLVRDLGVDRYRGTGCGRSVVLDCGRGCSVTEPAAPIAPLSEVAYRASFELLCAPSAVTIEEEDGTFTATCRGVGVRYACHGQEGCERLGAVDEARYQLRQLEPATLHCFARSRVDLRISFDESGHIVRVDADGMRPVRMRGLERDREVAETKQECVRHVFEPFPAYPALAATDVVFEIGGPDARRPSQLSVLAPPAPPAEAPAAATEPAPVESAPEPAPTAEATSPEQVAAEASLRAALDGRADAILACTGTPSAVVTLHAEAEGPLTVALRGPLAGSPEEGCVRSAVGALERPAGLAAGTTIVHLVEVAAAPAP